MTDYDFTLGPPLGLRANLGLIVLQSDETIEHDFRRLMPPAGVALHVTRIASAPEVTTEYLGQMTARMTAAAALLPRPVGFDVVGYGCTSGATVIGAGTVAQRVRDGVATRAVTEPLSALLAACAALGVTRLALLSPYVAEVADALREALARDGVATPVFGSFNEAEETRVARIDGDSITAAVRDMARRGEAEAVFMSCTNLRSLDVIAPLEAELGLPVLSSNQVLAWHMLRQAGLEDRRGDMGRLLAL